MFEPDSRLGPYQIIGKLGEGGMGEVYRARDTKLNREVALKILPEVFAHDADRLARFSREAQTLAALNHPNIAQIHGLEEGPPAGPGHAPTRALVMEFVDGEDLSQRLRRGALPLDEAVAIARQVADALEAAHEQGIVHRDLKPANIKARADGTVKVLDFGLAKATTGAGRAGGTGSPGLAELSFSPTLTSPAAMTAIGVILGTAAYMSPEQAKGKVVDKRADIWAFGVVLFEMLAGRPLFEGETVSEVLAAVIMKDPDLAALPATVPLSVRHLITRCLVKDPRLRLRDIGEARLVLAAPASSVIVGSDGEERPRHNPRAHRWLAVPAVALLLALAMAGFALWRMSSPAPSPITRFEVRPLDKTTLAIGPRPGVALSPDGSTLAFVGTSEGVARLYLRRRHEADPRPLPGTEDASNPIFSPSGAELAFFADGKLKKIRLDGSVSVVASPEVDFDPRGAVWLADGTIVFAPTAAGPLFQVSSAGGAARAISKLDQKKGERTHRWPSALPGGNAVLFTIGTLNSPDNYDNSTIDALVLATGERKVVLEGASSARFAATGDLLFMRGSTLYAVRLDVDRLAIRGSPVQVLDAVSGDRTTGSTDLAVSGDGTLVYVRGSGQAGFNRLVWVDRQGMTKVLNLPPGTYWDPRISPDGSRLAVAWTNPRAGNSDIWVSDLARETFTRLTFTGNAASPVWSADGRTIYYVHIAPDGRQSTILRKPADGSRDAEPLVQLEPSAYLNSVTPDGKYALFDYRRPELSGIKAVARIALEANAKLEPIIATPSRGSAGIWSPDRRWLAYQSDESGRFEIYVRDTTAGGGRWQVSTTGGEEPRWSADGRELFYRNDTKLMAVSIDARSTFEQKTPAVLFDGVLNFRSDSGFSFDVDPKGGRFLMIRLVNDAAAPRAVDVVLNWFEELRRLTANKQ